MLVDNDGAVAFQVVDLSDGSGGRGIGDHQVGVEEAPGRAFREVIFQDERCHDHVVAGAAHIRYAEHALVAHEGRALGQARERADHRIVAVVDDQCQLAVERDKGVCRFELQGGVVEIHTAGDSQLIVADAVLSRVEREFRRCAGGQRHAVRLEDAG
jgi:hypothetical protein